MLIATLLLPFAEAPAFALTLVRARLLDALLLLLGKSWTPGVHHAHVTCTQRPHVVRLKAPPRRGHSAQTTSVSTSPSAQLSHCHQPTRARAPLRIV